MANIFELLKQLGDKNEGNTSAPVSFLIAGLGNPGEKYVSSRHNTGFLFIDYICQKRSFEVKRVKFKSLCGEVNIDGTRVLVIKPSTYMNNSGEAVREAAEFYKLPPERVLVIYDDVNIGAGAVRIRAKGSDGGHNGIKSIIYHLKSNAFPRIRIGVGAKPSPEWDLADWVLGAFTSEEQKKVFSAFEAANDALPLMLKGDIAAAQSKYNRQ